MKPNSGKSTGGKRAPLVFVQRAAPVYSLLRLPEDLHNPARLPKTPLTRARDMRRPAGSRRRSAPAAGRRAPARALAVSDYKTNNRRSAFN